MRHRAERQTPGSDDLPLRGSSQRRQQRAIE
jgi:hypothetical protein